MQEKQAAKATEGYPDTVRQFAAIWMDEVVSRSNRDPGALQRVLDEDILPYIGNRRLESVTPNILKRTYKRLGFRDSREQAI